MDQNPRSKWTCSMFNYDCIEIKDVILSEDSNYDSNFESIVQKFKKNFVDGGEVGAQLSVFYKGQNVINIAAGQMNSEKGKKYDLNTSQTVYSISKALCSFVISMLVDRNLLKFEDLISKHWPEFTKFNKEKITIGELMHHKSGLIYPRRKFKLSELQNYDVLSKILVDEVEHVFEGESKSAYSSVIGGFFINEIIRRVDPKKRSIDVFVDEEINKPLNINLKFKVSENYFNDNVATLYLYPIIPTIWHFFNGVVIHPIKVYLGLTNEINTILDLINSNSLDYKSAFFFEKEYIIDLRNDYEAHSFLSPSGGLKANAHSLAKLGALISNFGELNGIRLISKETLEKSIQVLELEYDELLNYKLYRTLNGWGYYTDNDEVRVVNEISHSFGWTGFGGSMLNWSFENNVSFSYTMNGMAVAGTVLDDRSIKLLNEFYKVLKRLEK